MLLQSETLYVYTTVIRDTMDKSNATYVTIWTINTTTTTTTTTTATSPMVWQYKRSLNDISSHYTVRLFGFLDIMV